MALPGDPLGPAPGDPPRLCKPRQTSRLRRACFLPAVKQTALLTDRGTGTSGERGHGDGARALSFAAGARPSQPSAGREAQNLALLQAASPNRFSWE